MIKIKWYFATCSKRRRMWLHAGPLTLSRALAIGASIIGPSGRDSTWVLIRWGGGAVTWAATDDIGWLAQHRRYHDQS